MTNDEFRSYPQDKMQSSTPSSEHVFDLEERTARLAESVIAFASTVRVNVVTAPLIPQLVRAATSIGANYCEADDAGSKKEFAYRVSLCRREARETKYWLRMLVKAAPTTRDEAARLWQEAKELHLIFAAIHRRAKNNASNAPRHR